MKKVLIKWGVGITALVLCVAVMAVIVGNMQSAPVKYGISGTVDYTAGEETEPAPGIIENESLSLSFDENYNISVLNKKTGRVWSSNVTEEKSDMFNVSSESALSSVMLTYLNGEQEAEYSSYMQSVKKEQARLYGLSDNSVRVTYIFGERLNDDIIPPALTEKRYKEIYNSVDEDWQDFLKRRYQLFDSKTMTEADNPQEKYELYPELKNRPLYIISDKNGKVIAEKTKKLFTEIGYTKEDYAKDNKLSGYAGNTDECVFKVSLDFSLENNDLTVTMPVSEMEFYKNYPLLSVTPLQFFTSSANKSGSVLVPDGSGAVMNYTADNKPAVYESRVYGTDSTEDFDVLPTNMYTENDTTVSMPVYFFSEENETVMTVIESGAAAARFHINKDKQSTYAYTTFDIVQTGFAALTENNKRLVCGSDSLKTDIKLRYRFLNFGGDYVKSAVEYRDYLEKNSLLPNVRLAEKPMLLIETVGAVGVKNDKLKKLTAMSEAYDILKYMSEKTGGRISLKLSGFNKDGALKQCPGKYTFNKKLGNEKTFGDISALSEKTGGFAYLQLNHLYYYNHSFADGFDVKKNTAMLPDKSWAVHGSYNVVEGSYNTSDKKIWVISPKQYKNTAEDYLHKNFSALGLGNFAGTVNSDYNRENYFDRDRSVKSAVEAMNLYYKAGIKLAAAQANLYSYKYLSLIENMPANGSGSSVFDGEVPFCQIVLHGSLEYTVSAINAQSDETAAVLKAVETGSGLHYVLNRNIDNSLFDTNSTALFSSSFAANSESAVKHCNSVIKALDGLNNRKIINHYYIGDVAVTVYDNGSKIYVNYSSQDKTVEGNSVSARNWLKIDE